VALTAGAGYACWLASQRRTAARVGRASPQLKRAAVEGFASKYGGAQPQALGIAPGRAEILGNHTDYNEGFILAAAIDRHIVVAGRRSSGSTSRVASEKFAGLIEFQAGTPPPKKAGDEAWANYLLGVVDEFAKIGVNVGAFDAYVTGDVPAGSGASSSAALEMATAKLLQRLFPETASKLSQIDVIKACKAAENNFVGMGCGILDQFSSGMGKAGQLVHLDCRDLSYGYVPLTGARLVLANTHAPHQLVDGKYDELRRACFDAAETLQKAMPSKRLTHLRDVTVEEFETHEEALPRKSSSCARHIVYENDRVQKVIMGLRSNDLQALGEAMSASHASSRDDFGNSCKELDIMFDCAEGIPGMLGRRLMGGGFGGCTINLVVEQHAESFQATLAARYRQKTGTEPTILICNTSNGACSEVVQ